MRQVCGEKGLEKCMADLLNCLQSIQTLEMRRSDSKQDFTAKLIILGNSGVGKTSLLMRLCQGTYSQNFIATIGMDYKIKMMKAADHKSVKLNIWDTAGQQRYKVLTKSFYNGAQGIVLVYSVNDRNSFHDIWKWIKQIENNVNQNVELMILANKCDVKVRDVTKEEGERMAQKYSARFMEVSAKADENVLEAFEMLARELRPRKQESIFLTGSSETDIKPNKKRCCQ